MKQTKRKCEYIGCEKLGRNKGFYKGKTRYDRFCELHHRLRYKISDERLSFFGKGKIENKKCEICGWDKAFCDRHRINPKKGYIKENIKILCPNCHRLETIRLSNGHPKK
jgi:hypothetical protein